MARDEWEACMSCGGLDLKMLSVSEGLAAEGGELLRSVCRDCDWQGIPLLFDEREAYEAFLGTRG